MSNKTNETYDSFAVSPMAMALKGIVAQEGIGIYQDVNRLSSILIEKNIPIKKIKQLELALLGSTIGRFLDGCSAGLKLIDINNMIIALEQCGLSTWDARNILADILYSLSIPQMKIDLFAIEDERSFSELMAYVPPFVYEDTLNEYAAQIDEEEPLDADQFAELNRFAEADIPFALYLMGCIYLRGLADEVAEDKRIAMKYIRRAAEHGYGPAFAILGDFAYARNDFDRAYALYSKPGAIALNADRCEKMEVLLKAKAFAKNIVKKLSLIGILASLLMFTAFAESPLTRSHPYIGIVCLVVNFLAIVGMIILHKRKPFMDLRYCGIAFASTFFVYILFLLM